ncbi:MAG: cob(I)yrinic acid a,c-diamide adenosyltransferase [Planctomycetota bacterium]|nr:MAG: cob(I)yrinic acid a,c-diamide adenosyltransferase [Planctomycetota bacterium]
MVKLDRIYTGIGDAGTTRLADGTEVPKDHPRVEAYGCVDEANALCGLIRCETLPEGMADLMAHIGNDLFDLGSDLATPPDGPYEASIPRVKAVQVAFLEKAIDQWNARLHPLTSFVIPGGSRAACLFHQVRTVARRAEREAWRCHHAAVAAGQPGLNGQALVYMNRLSDLFFVCARVCNNDGYADVLWVPGKHG